MKRPATTWCVLVLLLLALGAAGCSSANATNAAPPGAAAVTVEAGTDESQPATLTVSALAEKRLGIRTEAVRSVRTGSVSTLSLPYAALVYDAEGNPWAFSSPTPRTYVRVPLVIRTIEGDRVQLTSGPPAGTQVVVVGAPELVGAEAGISGEE
jgi:hypothetical protein